jgi:hypothetical protein
MKFISILLLILMFSISISSMAGERKRETPLSLPAASGLPGQIEQAGNLTRIYFEDGILVEWSGTRAVLKDAKNQSISVQFNAIPEKQTFREMMGEEVTEQDLGGSSKKKTPLAYKNPRFRNISLPQVREDPLKAAKMKPAKVKEEKMLDGGAMTTTEYPDGSRGVVYVSPSLKEESSFNKKGDLVWRNLEGEEKGLRFKKTQWEDGSTIREYANPQGILSVLFDQERKVTFFSFLNPERQAVKEVVCQTGECE